MPLQSYLFAGNARLERCLVSHPDHVKPGDSGPHVQDIQIALEFLDGLEIDAGEKERGYYGPSTAKAVLAYKTKRKIINTSYQSTPDNIVGIMTMTRLDKDMVESQTVAKRSPSHRRCARLNLGDLILNLKAPPIPVASLARRVNDRLNQQRVA